MVVACEIGGAASCAAEEKEVRVCEVDGEYKGPLNKYSFVYRLLVTTTYTETMAVRRKDDCCDVLWWCVQS